MLLPAGGLPRPRTRSCRRGHEYAGVGEVLGPGRGRTRQALGRSLLGGGSVGEGVAAVALINSRHGCRRGRGLASLVPARRGSATPATPDVDGPPTCGPHHYCRGSGRCICGTIRRGRGSGSRDGGAAAQSAAQNRRGYVRTPQTYGSGPRARFLDRSKSLVVNHLQVRATTAVTVSDADRRSAACRRR